MYRVGDMWDDAFRVAKQQGGASAAKQVTIRVGSCFAPPWTCLYPQICFRRNVKLAEI